MHGASDVDLDDDLTRGSHARDDTIVAWQADSHMDMVTRHLVQTRLHDQGKWLHVSTMDYLTELEGVIDLGQELFVLHVLQRVALHCPDVAHFLLRHQLEALLVVVVDNVLDNSLRDIHSFEVSDR